MKCQTDSTNPRIRAVWRSDRRCENCRWWKPNRLEWLSNDWRSYGECQLKPRTTNKRREDKCSHFDMR